MGLSAFICNIESGHQFEAAVRSIIMHNATAMTPIGGSYSDEEFDVLDPMRAATARSSVSYVYFLFLYIYTNV
jgi:hypothetical protein